MACLTASGAAAGAAARPLTIFASTPGTVGWASVRAGGARAAGGAAGGSSYDHATRARRRPWRVRRCDEREREQRADEHQGRSPHDNSLSSACGLADGLARKEPAPPMDRPRIRPNNLGSPVPRSRPGVRRCMQGIGRSPGRPNRNLRSGDRPSVQTLESKAANMGAGAVVRRPAGAPPDGLPGVEDGPGRPASRVAIRGALRGAGLGPPPREPVPRPVLEASSGGAWRPPRRRRAVHGLAGALPGLRRDRAAGAPPPACARSRAAAPGPCPRTAGRSSRRGTTSRAGGR
jgi:hypothetical protein